MPVPHLAPLTVQIRAHRHGVACLAYGFEAVLRRADGAELDRVWTRYDVTTLPDLARARWGDLPTTYADGTDRLIAELRADEARA